MRDSKGATDHLFSRVIVETYRDEPQLLWSFFVRYVLGTATNNGYLISWVQYYTAGLSEFRPTNGPQSAQIFDLVKTYFKDFPDYMPTQWRNHPGTTIETIASDISQQPDEDKFWFLWEVIDRLKGRLESGPIIIGSLFEFDNIFYLKSVLLIDKLAEAFLGVPTNNRLGKLGYDDASVFMYATSSVDLPQTMRDEIASRLQPERFNRVIARSPYYQAMIRWYTASWLIMRNVLNIAIVATLPFCFIAGTGWLAALMTLIWLGNIAVVAVITDPYIRYVDAVVPLSMMIAALSVASLLRALKARRYGTTF